MSSKALHFHQQSSGLKGSDMKNAISTILTAGADESPGPLTFSLHQLYQFQYKLFLPPLHIGSRN
jgi:hypothetical protein